MGNGPDIGDLNPEQIVTVRQFAQALKTIQVRSGRSLRDIARETRSMSGSKTTFSVMLKGERLPAKAHVDAFLQGCGLTGEQIEPWLLAWERLAGGSWPQEPGHQGAGVSEDTGPIRVVNVSRPRRFRMWGVAAAAFVLGSIGVWSVIRLSGPTDPPPGGEACRGYQEIARAGVAINPCVEPRDGQVRMSVYIKALTPSGTDGEVTAYVWLTHRDSKAKLRESLHTCPVSLGGDHKVITCARAFTPPTAGYYYVAASAQTGVDPLPPEWSPQWTGTQSPTLYWRS
ncbi:hypothetical protein ACFQ08_08680 [Streptosporangium algeriense]|uniref:HTH cro/C1-type domain-containing protein n=1 Tax=Streptosporangium algeriense TaxID=1682748 RepID=A0ABW3DNP6_9ACTN